MANDGSVTELLVELTEGDRSALERVVPLVYDELRAMAQRALRHEDAGHTLSPTALVHEAYLKLVRLERLDWRGRAHFFGVCAGEMRRILINHAHARQARKRGGSHQRTTLAEDAVIDPARPEALIALDEALTRLQQANPRQARVVECRFFVGMSIEDTAEALHTSPATVKRDWTLARAWLNRELAA